MASYTPKPPFRLRELLVLFDLSALSDDGLGHEINWDKNPETRLVFSGPFVTERMDDLEEAKSVLRTKTCFLRGIVGTRYYDQFLQACRRSPEKNAPAHSLMCCFKAFDLVEVDPDYGFVKRVIQRAVPIEYRFKKSDSVAAEYEVFDGPWKDIIWNKVNPGADEIDAHWMPARDLRTAFGGDEWEEYQLFPSPLDDFLSPLYRLYHEDGTASVGFLIFQNALGAGAYDPTPLFLWPIISLYIDDEDVRLCVLHETFVNDVDCIAASEIIPIME